MSCKSSAFQCDPNCGLCCSELPPEILTVNRLPINEVRGKGCANLNADKTCAIYGTRPDLCNVETMYRKVSRSIPISWDSFKEMNRNECRKLQSYFGWKGATS